MTDTFISQLQAALGPSALLTDPADMAPYLSEERGLFSGCARAVIRPATTEDVAQAVRLCADHGVGIVPQGGNTGLTGGACPDYSGDVVVISLSRMNRIRSIDRANFSMTVEAGVILETVQKTAAGVDCLFPLTMGAEGSCQIGGNIATNAGGSGVLRYGNTRDLVMGLEVVLPDGRIWNGLRALRKDNTGYALKHLFISGEGTLGIITAAVIKLFPAPKDVQTAFVALADLDSALALLSRVRAESGDQATAFELIPRLGVELTSKLIPGVSDPFNQAYDWYVLVELASSRVDSGLLDTLEEFLGAAIEAGEVADAVIAKSGEQRHALWHMREGLPIAEKQSGGGIKHDVSVPVSLVPAFLRAATEGVKEAMPGVGVLPFGHVGDGNIHFNLLQPVGMDRAAFIEATHRVNRVVHDIVASMEGSISAEHGIGQLKKDELGRYKSEVEIDLMKKIKAAIDPAGIMNPGKLL